MSAIIEVMKSASFNQLYTREKATQIKFKEAQNDKKPSKLLKLFPSTLFPRTYQICEKEKRAFMFAKKVSSFGRSSYCRLKAI
jgi:hypothetical protein